MAAQADTQPYIVVPGDSLSRIAQKHDTSVETLLTLNALDNPNQLSVGQTILVPAQNVAPPAPAPQPVSQPPTAPVADQAGEIVPVLYVVQAGDNLAKVARNHGTTVDELIKINELESDVLQLGQQLIVGYKLVIPDPPPPPAPDPLDREPASELTIDFQTPTIVEGWITGPPEFVAGTSEALGWLAAFEPAIYQLAQTYITEIIPSNDPGLAWARLRPNGTCQVAMLEGDMMVVASVIYHEALHCAHFLRGVFLTEEQEEAYAYAHQLEFAKRHNMPQDFIDELERKWFLFALGLNPYRG